MSMFDSVDGGGQGREVELYDVTKHMMSFFLFFLALHYLG